MPEGRCCAEIIEVSERQAADKKRLDEGEARMTRFEDKLDRIIFLQYGALVSAVGALALVLLRK